MAGPSLPSLTEDLAAQVRRVEADPGPDPGTRDLEHHEYVAMALGLLAQHDPEHLWVFAYGSLIWDPEFAAEHQVPARLAGMHRSFCIRISRWRGTREFPGLMMALDRGGSCRGVAFRLPRGDRVEQVRLLLEREVDALPVTNTLRWARVNTREGNLTALVTVADPRGPAYAGRLPHPVVAKVLAHAAGHSGTMAEYLARTVAHLETHGLRDRNLWRLQALVAAEIRESLVSGSRPTIWAPEWI